MPIRKITARMPKGIKLRSVSLCIHFIDGKLVQRKDGKDWRKCEPTGKDVCPCRDCTRGCTHYADH